MQRLRLGLLVVPSPLGLLAHRLVPAFQLVPVAPVVLVVLNVQLVLGVLVVPLVLAVLEVPAVLGHLCRLPVLIVLVVQVGQVVHLLPVRRVVPLVPLVLGHHSVRVDQHCLVLHSRLVRLVVPSVPVVHVHHEGRCGSVPHGRNLFAAYCLACPVVLAPLVRLEVRQFLVDLVVPVALVGNDC